MQLHEEDFMQLRDKVDTHIKEYKLFLEAYISRQKQQDLAQEQLMEAVKELNINIVHLTESTQGLVDAWKVATGLQRFIVWASQLAVVGGIISWIAIKLTGIKVL